MAKVTIVGGMRWENETLTENKEISIHTNERDDSEIHLSDQDVLLSGFTDFHMHLWGPGVDMGLPGVRPYSEGMVACVEAGHFGYENWEAADRHWRNYSPMEIRSFVEVIPEGMTRYPPYPPRDITPPERISVDRLVEIFERAEPGRALGVKVHLGWQNAENDRQLMKIAQEAVRRTNTRLMVHISGAYIPIEETVEYLRKGDIITHLYAGFRNNVLMDDGSINRVVHKARDAGVLIDLGHAGKHFSWKIFRAAQRESLVFDTLGSDLTANSWKNESKWRLIDFTNLFSMMLNAGLTLEDALKKSTSVPNSIAHIPTYPLSEKLLIIKKYDTARTYYDGLDDVLEGTYEYMPVYFVDRGSVIRNKFI